MLPAYVFHALKFLDAVNFYYIPKLYEFITIEYTVYNIATKVNKPLSILQMPCQFGKFILAVTVDDFYHLL